MIARAERRSAATLATPFAIAVVVLILVPALMTLVLAFTHYDGLRAPQWAGLDNFTRFLGDVRARTALFNSIVFAAFAVPLRLMAATGLALLLARRARGASAARALAYLPTIVPDVAWGLLWLWILNPLYGPLGRLLETAGVSQGLLLSAWGARAGIVVMTLFQIGEGFVVALAARRDVPDVLYEVARLEGASPWWTFRRVTLPHMAPTLGLLAARDVAFSFQASFIPALVVTGGGPFYATTFLPLYTYTTAFEFFRLGYAAALTVTMFVVTALMIGAQVFVVRRIRRR